MNRGWNPTNGHVARMLATTRSSALVREARTKEGIRLALARRPLDVAPFFSRLGTGAGFGRALFLGVDTLALFYEPAPLENAFANELDRLKLLAVDGPAILDAGPYAFMVEAYGAKGGFTWVLRSPIATALVKRNGAVHLTFRSVLLTALGPKIAVEELSAVVASWRTGPKWGIAGAGEPTVSRIDLCADIRAPCATVDTVKRMVSRARTRPRWGIAARVDEDGNPKKVTEENLDRAVCEILKTDPGGDVEDIAERVLRALGAKVWRDDTGELHAEHESETVYHRGAEETGITVGKGQLMFRWYDKLREIKGTAKEYMMAIYKRVGYIGGPVSRIEFQLRKGALSTFVAVRACGRKWSGVSRLLGELWAYLTRSWLTLRLEGENKQRTRWKIDPLWTEIQGIGWPKVAMMKRSSLASPLVWVQRAVEGEFTQWRLPIKGAQSGPASYTPFARVRVESRRRGLHLNAHGHGVLREAGYSKLRALEAGLAGYLAAVLALTGGRVTPQMAALEASRRPQFDQQVKTARARQVLRASEELQLVRGAA